LFLSTPFRWSGEVVEQVVRRVREQECQGGEDPEHRVEPAGTDRKQAGDRDRDERDDEDRRPRDDEPARHDVELQPRRAVDPAVGGFVTAHHRILNQRFGIETTD
jgi:hypothetical protein